jgi:hypothetical protein
VVGGVIDADVLRREDKDKREPQALRNFFV